MLQLLSQLKQHSENGFVTEGELWDTLPLEVMKQLKPYIDHSREYSPIVADYVVPLSSTDWRQQMLDWLLEEILKRPSPLPNESYWRCSVLLRNKYKLYKADANGLLDWAIHEEKLFPCPGIYGEEREDDLLCVSKNASVFLSRATSLVCYDWLFQEVKKNNPISLAGLLQSSEDAIEVAYLNRALDSAVAAGLIEIIDGIIVFKP